MPMSRRTPEELREKIYSRNWGVREFAILQEQLGDDLLFSSLFSLFSNPEISSHSYEAQDMAGTIMMELNPACPITAIEFLRSTLQNWNKSVEQLPLYLVQQFGRDGVLDAVSELENEPGISKHFCGKLATCRYWLRTERYSPPRDIV